MQTKRRNSRWRTRVRRAAPAAIAALFALSAVARADNFWQPPTAVENERRADYERWMDIGDKNAILAGRLSYEPEAFPLDRRSLNKRKRFAITRAVAAYEKAFDALPDAPEPYYRAAEVLNNYFVEKPENTPVIVSRYKKYARQAIAYWQQFERLAPLDPRVHETLFKRALVHTRMADEDNYKQAVALYEAIIRRSDVDSELRDNVATWYGNLAETYMMLGDLERAIETFQVAIDASNRSSTGYGLAVALDRDEQGEMARDVIRRYGEDGLRIMLYDASVFYVPVGERFYYIALGYDAFGYWHKAAENYEAFIASGAHPQYQQRAKDNLAFVREQLREMRRRNFKPPEVPGSLSL